MTVRQSAVECRRELPLLLFVRIDGRYHSIGHQSLKPADTSPLAERRRVAKEIRKIRLMVAFEADHSTPMTSRD